MVRVGKSARRKNRVGPVQDGGGPSKYPGMSSDQIVKRGERHCKKSLSGSSNRKPWEEKEGDWKSSLLKGLRDGFDENLANYGTQENVGTGIWVVRVLVVGQKGGIGFFKLAEKNSKIRPQAASRVDGRQQKQKKSKKKSEQQGDIKISKKKHRKKPLKKKKKI